MGIRVPMPACDGDIVTIVLVNDNSIVATFKPAKVRSSDRSVLCCSYKGDANIIVLSLVAILDVSLVTTPLHHSTCSSTYVSDLDVIIFVNNITRIAIFLDGIVRLIISVEALIVPKI